MEVTQEEKVIDANMLYNHAAHLLINEKKTDLEVINSLMSQGVDRPSASTVVRRLQDEIKEARKEAARKDILWGAIWCLGGTALTLANVGFIFWGAILFGGIQLVKGIINSID